MVRPLSVAVSSSYQVPYYTKSRSIDPLAFLLSPHSENLKVDRHLRRQIVRYLTTCFEILSRVAEALIPDELEQWGRLRIGNGGDEVHARGYHKLRADGRDAAFVRVSSY
jgi:hypothetical protein